MFESLPATQSSTWRQLAVDLDGEYRESILTRPIVSVNHAGYTITLDAVIEARVLITRLQTSFTSTDGFQFLIFRRHIFSPIAEFFGGQDVEIGHPDFDRDFIIRSNHEDQVRRLFSNERLRFLLSNVEEPHLQTVTQTDMVVAQQPMTLDFRVPGMVIEVRELKGYVELVAAVLDQLHAIGSGRP